MKFEKSKLAAAVATAAIGVAGAFVAPQAMAHSAAERAAQANDAKVRSLEAQMNQMKSMMSQMQAELDSTKMATSRQSPKVQELDDWMQAEKNKPVVEDTKDNMVFFRGGFARSDETRNGVSIYSTVAGSNLGLPGDQADKDGWYFGAGFDFSLTPDIWGFMDNTEVLAELMFDYKYWGLASGNALTQSPTGLVTGNLTQEGASVTVNQFTLAASPKIKFLKGSSFRPWLIPIGFELNVISPPSQSITVLNPGVQFGAGADYNLWKAIYVGADARYHLGSEDADGVNTDGWTMGGYLGLGF